MIPLLKSDRKGKKKCLSYKVPGMRTAIWDIINGSGIELKSILSEQELA